MGDRTDIEWTDHTFNPWTGCTRISPGCDNCYAAQLAKRNTSTFGSWEPGAERKRTGAANWRGPVKWNRDAEKAARRAKVFCASMADVFDNQAPAEWRADLWALIRATPWLQWQLLTKRPQNITKMLPPDWGHGFHNVWLGTTVENQTQADARIPHLLAVPAVIHFLSCEPLLGPVDLRAIYQDKTMTDALDGMSEHPVIDAGDRMVAINPNYRNHASIDWVIAGGETGGAARPWSIQWARALRDQCASAGTPFFWKQNGEWQPAGSHFSDDDGKFAFGDYEHDPGQMIVTDHYPRQFTRFGARSVMERVGKKRAGNMLDGRQHVEFPG